MDYLDFPGGSLVKYLPTTKEDQGKGGGYSCGGLVSLCFVLTEGPKLQQEPEVATS